jgi:hypothetical protein
MGEKANRFIAAAAAIVVGIAGAAQLANGFWTMFGPASLPECQSTDASDLVKKIIADNFQVTLERVDEIAESTFDETAQKRSCTATIFAGEEGVFEIAYDLTWHDRDEKMVAAEVSVLRQRS